jgi:hypothetical protein
VSRPVGKSEYPEKEEPGPLRLVSTADGSERTIAPRTRSYGWGNRAVVWRDDDELVYIDGSGRTALLDVSTGKSRILVPQERESMGWLLDPDLRVATNAAPVFAPYDRASRTVLERDSLGGCEPYFTADGRWGFWVAGAGGPLNRIDLETREVTPVLRKNDPRLDPERRYLYFTMTSRDGRMLTWGASDGDHHHFEADYDVYVAPIDPETLELAGRPVRMTEHPATDRYPDVFLAPLPLGRHRGEAPFTVELRAPRPGPWRWSIDGRPVAGGESLTRTFGRPGVHRVEARTERGGGDASLAGQVVVDPPRAPEVTGVELREGDRRLEVRFSEPVRTQAAKVELDPASALASWRAGDEGRTLSLELTEELRAGGRLRLTGVTDRAQVPNALAPSWIEVAPPTWPSSREGLELLWQTADLPNLVFDPATGKERAYPLEAVGRAFLDHHHALAFDGGRWLAPPEAGDRFVTAVERDGAFSVELTLTPESTAGRELGAVVALFGGSRLQLLLGQRGRDLVLRLATSEQRDAPMIRLAGLEAGRAHHLVLSYSPGRLRVWLDGESVAPELQPRGHLNRWRGGRLSFGGRPDGGLPWQGTLEGIALWSRALEATEAREESVRYRRVRSGRPEVDSRRVETRLLRKSAIPTLAQITPYRVALVVFEHEVTRGDDAGERLRVAHWAILDGEMQPVSRLRPGTELTLRLEPFAANPQLEPHFLSDTLGGGGGELWYAVGAE